MSTLFGCNYGWIKSPFGWIFVGLLRIVVIAELVQCVFDLSGHSAVLACLDDEMNALTLAYIRSLVMFRIAFWGYVGSADLTLYPGHHASAATWTLLTTNLWIWGSIFAGNADTCQVFWVFWWGPWIKTLLAAFASICVA